MRTVRTSRTLAVTGVLALSGVIVVSATTFIWRAAHGSSVLAVFPFCLVAWSAYLVAHYIEEDEWVDDIYGGDGTDEGLRSLLPSSRFRLALTALGFASMFVAFPGGILAVHRDAFDLLLVSHALFIGGYLVGHYGLTEKLL